MGSGQPARLGKVARHFGGCGSVQGNEGATYVEHPSAALVTEGPPLLVGRT